VGANTPILLIVSYALANKQETIQRASFFARNPFVCSLEPKTCQNAFGILPRFFENLLMSENSGVIAEG